MPAAEAANARACPVCGAPLGAPIYDHPGPTSITSLAQPISGPTRVFLCRTCAHASSSVLERVGEYYDTEYNILTEADAADDLYEIRDGEQIYRAAHQAAVALQRLELPRGPRVLDYGCAKAASLHEIVRQRPDVVPFTFDVSENYKAFWNRFVPAANQAAYDVPDGWQGSMDAVLAFFALEHVAQPSAFVRTVVRLLKPDGTLHFVFPNVRRNPGDLIVADHVNHFMPSSIRWLLEEAGCKDVRIDEDAHTAAYVVNAKRGALPASGSQPEAGAVAGYVREVEETAMFWRAARDRLAAFESAQARGVRAAIYGSGFYGAFIASSLAQPNSVACFLDQNPYQRMKRPFGKDVRAPDSLDPEVGVVYVGLNPKRAREIIAGVTALHERPRAFFYL